MARSQSDIIIGKRLGILFLPLLAFFVKFLISTPIMQEQHLVAPQEAPSWKYSPQEVIELTHKTINSTNDLYDSLVLVESPTVETFVKPIIAWEDEVSPLINQLTFLMYTSPDKEIRDASTKASEIFQKWRIDASSRHDLYLQYDKVWSSIKEDQEFKGSNPEIYRVVEKTHRDYVRAGLSLPEEKRKEVVEVKKKISLNSLQFASNLSEQSDFIAFTEEELEGVSETVMKQFEKITEDGVEKYKVTFKYPDIIPVMEMASNPETRKRAFIGNQNKVPENGNLLLETIRLRDELASMLGYKNFAAYKLEVQMAKSEEKVFEFITDLKEKLTSIAKDEVEVLKVLKKKEFEEKGLEYDGAINEWDFSYYNQKYLRENYNVNKELVGEYFPLQSSIDGMLKVYERIMRLKFVEEVDPSKKSVWHEDVKQLSVWNIEDEQNPLFTGWIYFDLHPRDGKYNHAANFGISSSYLRTDGTRSYPVTALVCNFSKPSKEKPSLLKHDELVTFFHELGHGIHDLVGTCGIGSLNGPSSMPQDFIEAPSQMLEYWPWNKDVLASLSSHYQTGQKAPEELLDSLVKTRKVNSGILNLKQLFYSFFDMRVHTYKGNFEDLDVLTLWNDLRKNMTHIDNSGIYTHGYNSFNHIMSENYPAGYYGYMWAKVFAADMYYTMFEKDPYSSEAGKRYVDIVLAKGGLREPEDSLFELLSRAPNNKAFLKDLGLA